jgi:hypothetical protein
LQSIDLFADGTDTRQLVNHGVPLDLYRGNSSKYEAIKQSERLSARISGYIENINTGFNQAMIAEKFNKKIDELTKELRKDAKIVIK